MDNILNNLDEGMDEIKYWMTRCNPKKYTIGYCLYLRNYDCQRTCEYSLEDINILERIIRRDYDF